MTSSINNKTNLSSVKNALRLLRLYRTDRAELGITDIAKLLDLPKSTVHRLVQELVNEGFLIKRSHTNKYRLGLSILTLGGIIHIQYELYKEAHPKVEHLSNFFGQVVNLCLIENKKIVYFLQCIPHAQTEITTAMGFTKDVHCTAEGQVILAHQHVTTINQYVQQPLKKYTPYTHIGEALRQQLENIYKQGFAVTEHTYSIGYISFAYPIRDYTGSVVSAITLIAHESTISKDDYTVILEELKNVAAEISELLGYYS
ncbi:IclR family transcriptional regulator [Lysinibacillus sp. fls2-241-R2A-57]|uniref:IclR family transcriptional regulator n=1 Tax=Lysinibacillus sp. fls2-241-R2A-57 TaxID=3040292 RepID=UPI00255233D6|nr:IclR family transcriptional regulator [Lysinibacillus sp. fls2-241-R2A-57]